MEQHNHQYCQCLSEQQQLQQLQQQQQLLQHIQKQHIKQLREHCQHLCPSAFGHVGPIENLVADNTFNQCCDCHISMPLTADQREDKNKQNQNKNVTPKINKIVMHKINVEKVTIGKPSGKLSCENIKLLRSPKKPKRSKQQCPIHQQPSADVPGDNANAKPAIAQNIQLLDTSKGESKEIPLKLGLLHLPKNVKKDSNQQGQNVERVIAPVCSNIATNVDDPQRTAIVIVKPRNEKKDTGSLDMLVVCQGKDSEKLVGEQETEEVKEPVQEKKEPVETEQKENKPIKKCRKKRKPCAPPPPQQFGPPPPLLCTRSVCSIS